MDWDRILHLNKLPSHPKLLVIGGPPRCGKSTLAHEVMLTYGIDVVSGDAIRRVLASTGMSFLPIDPDTWAVNTAEFIHACKDRDSKVANACTVYAEQFLGDYKSIMVEGCLWADDLERFALPIRPRNGVDRLVQPEVLTVHLFNNAPLEAEQERLRAQCKEDPASWLNRYTAKQLDDFAIANRARGLKMAKIAREYGAISLENERSIMNIFSNKRSCLQVIIDAAELEGGMREMHYLASELISYFFHNPLHESHSSQFIS